MKRIFWSKVHITVLTDQIEANTHSHLMLQIFIKREGEIKVTIHDKIVSGNYIIIDSGVEHSIAECEKLDCFILIESASVAAKQLQNYYIKGNEYSVLPVAIIHDLFHAFIFAPGKETHKTFTKALFHHLGVSFYEPNLYDERLKALHKMLSEYSCLEHSIEQISKRLYLSPSRLSHIFNNQTGIPLKSYMVLYKLQKAYLLLFQGKSITEAAVEAGFSSPSHLADVNRRMMGMTISRAINDSSFLEVFIE